MPLERERAAVATPCRCDTHQPRRLACRRPWRKFAAGPLSRETGILSEPPGAAWTSQVTTRVRTSSSCARTGGHESRSRSI